MRSLVKPKDPIESIEDRIVRLGERACELHEREQAGMVELEDLRQSSTSELGRLQRRRHERALHRGERRVEALREKRHDLVQEELRSIMLSLEKQSHRTRERLDRELDRLAPVEEEWERLRGAFEALDGAVGIPALAELAGQWRGALKIPEFPVSQRSDYAKPFPEGALLF